MRKYIELENKTIEYTLRFSPRSRHVRLAVHGDGAVVVLAPLGISEALIERFIAQKSQWVRDKLEYFKRYPAVRPIQGSKKDYQRYKGEAMMLVLRRIEYFNSLYGFQYNRISIRNQRTRWGSCSRRRNLSFNYKIILLPDQQAD